MLEREKGKALRFQKEKATTQMSCRFAERPQIAITPPPHMAALEHLSIIVIRDNRKHFVPEWETYPYSA